MASLYDDSDWVCIECMETIPKSMRKGDPYGDTKYCSTACKSKMDVLTTRCNVCNVLNNPIELAGGRCGRCTQRIVVGADAKGMNFSSFEGFCSTCSACVFSEEDSSHCKLCKKIIHTTDRCMTTTRLKSGAITCLRC